MNRYAICIIACLTLGLAPFTPAPHLVEKIRWLATGAEVMRPIDWFDLALHGTPWVALIVVGARDAMRALRATQDTKQKP